MSNIQRRLERLRNVLRVKSVEAALITNPINVRYLTGFTGDDSALLIVGKTAFFITDFRYTEQARAELQGTGIRIVERKKAFLDAIAQSILRMGVKKVGFEPEEMTVQTHTELLAKIRSSAQTLQPTLEPIRGLVNSLRERKDSQEVAAIGKALRIAEAAFQAVVSELRPGISEREVALELEFQMKRRGAMAVSFPIIVAGGPRGALPHARPTERKLRAGEPIVIDWGAMVDFYCSDLTRTLFLDNIPKSWRTKYRWVLHAQVRGIAAVTAGVSAQHADRVARQYLKRHRLGRCFGHGLGHGVGMAVHEAPTVNAHSIVRLQPGMVITIEPGIYITGKGGIRIEDMILVRRDGAQVLSHLPKDIDAVVI